jgi:ATP-dependent Lhr-like helicase
VPVTIDFAPKAVRALTIIGRERMGQGTADDRLLIEAESLAEVAMRRY